MHCLDTGAEEGHLKHQFQKGTQSGGSGICQHCTAVAAMSVTGIFKLLDKNIHIFFV
jgi:hypothetical protein